MNAKQLKFLDLIEAKFGPSYQITSQEILNVVKENEIPYPSWIKNHKIKRGVFQMPDRNASVVEAISNVVPINKGKQVIEEFVPHIPEKDENFIPFGFYKDMVSVIKSKIFYPIFISGHHGSGKTQMVEQVCAATNREMIRVNISVETDEVDLTGGPTLIDGNVVNKDGPVIIAMRRGSVLLLDELDRGSNKLLAIMGILEGKPFFNKKTGETVYPAEGFNIIATTNTKGAGSDEGKYLAQILDTAFLERFPITVEQNYPDNKTEIKILYNLCNDKDFIEKMVRWAEVIRQTYDAGGIDDFISTRRLIHIIRAYEIFKDKLKAIELCINRFDTDTKNAFLELYTKIDSGIQDNLTMVIEDSEE